jgi:hypothetical protein
MAAAAKKTEKRQQQLKQQKCRSTKTSQIYKKTPKSNYKYTISSTK